MLKSPRVPGLKPESLYLNNKAEMKYLPRGLSLKEELKDWPEQEH